MPKGNFATEPERDQPYITYSEFVRRVWRFIAQVYNKSPHMGIGGDIPLRLYQASVATRMPRPLRKKDDLNVLLTLRRECDPSGGRAAEASAVLVRPDRYVLGAAQSTQELNALIAAL